MKVGIVTLPGNYNYGNRLQNYALEQTLLNIGPEVSTLIIKPSTEKRKFRISKVAKIIPKTIDILSGNSSKYKKMMSEKEKYILPFTRNYLHNIEFSEDAINKIDLFFVGSDQVWNPDYVGGDKNYFLDFVEPNKRFSYAASFGVSTIPSRFEEEYAYFLSKMKGISVREETGINIVTKLTGKKSILVPDPTMLLTKKQWQKLIQSQKQSSVPKKEKFIIVYMLDEFSQVKRRKVEQFANKNNYKIVQIMGDLYDESHYIFNPIEFIEAIQNAEMVFTDSFHCGVFSIVLNTPFIVFDRIRGGMSSRLSTLLDRFGFQKNLYCDNTDFERVKINTDFSHVPSILEEWKKIGIKYINNCLNTVSK